MLNKAFRFIKNIKNKINGEKCFLSCNWLEHGIIFDHANIIRVCCEQSHEGRGRYVLDDKFNGIWFDKNKIITEKRKLRNSVRKGIIPDSCRGCQFLKYDYWDNKDYFADVLLTHWTNCNTRCIYCPAVRDNNLSDEYVYNIIPILQQMFDDKLIDSNTKFSIAGGEATIYPEFDKLIYFLLETGINNININTSGIRFCHSIAEAISQNAAEVCISLDSSSAYMHKKIKCSDTFNIVVNNIKRYLEYQQLGEERVIVKFIILKGINDNKKELLDWFMLSRNLGVKKLAVDIDIAWFKEIENNIPDYLKMLIIFIKQMAEINSVHLDLYDRADKIYKMIKFDHK